MTGDVAEVVGITEEIHPAELETGHVTTAELVGTDSNIAVAVHSDAATSLEHQAVAGEHTDAVVINDSQTTAVHEMGAASQSTAGVCVAQAVLTHQSSSVTTIADGHTGVDTPEQTIQEATPVDVMAVEESIQDNNPPRTAQDFYDYPIKPEPMFRSSTDTQIPTSMNERNQATSEPLNGNFETSSEEPAWTRAPSFGGTSPSDGIPEPLIPPMAATAVFEDSSELPPEHIPPAIPVPQAPEVTVSSMTRASGGSQISDSRGDGFGNGVNTVSHMFFALHSSY